MKMIKAKFYPETNEVIPLDPQPIRVQGQFERIPSTGTDEIGEYIIIDFVQEKDVLFEYDTKAPPKRESDLLEIKEEEWNQ